MDIPGTGPAPFGPVQRVSYSQAVRQPPTTPPSRLGSTAARPAMQTLGSRHAVSTRPQPPQRGVLPAGIHGARELVRQHAHELKRL